ncbi:MAG: M4 family metallopeptidase [Vicinamibacterales bacterium]
MTSRTRIIAVVLVTSIVGLLATSTSSQQPSFTPPGQPFSILGNQVQELRQADTFITDGARRGTLRLRSVVPDLAVQGRVVERFEQFHQGVRIWGADIVRDSERGVPLSIFGMLSPDLTLSVEPSLTPSAARDALRQLAVNDSSLLAVPELVVVRLDDGTHRLAYTGAVSGSGEVARVFIDARTGAELMRYSEIQRQAAVGTGTGVLGDQKKLSVQSTAGTFRAFDQHRPPIIETFDARGNLARLKLLLNGLLPYTVSDLASDADNVWTDVSVVDAHVHVSWTYDYYFKRFGRSGLDGRNGPIDIVVNAVSQQGALSLPSADLIFAVNAFFCSVCGPDGRGLMFFGNGIPPGVFMSNGRNYTYFSGALDIAAHELTHAVTSATSNLLYRNESGALNEAFSDMMGKSVEFFYHPPGSGVGQADYVLGKDISRAVRPGALNGDRSMANPGLYGDPDHYSRRYLGQIDNGGVHTNSGIANQAFYLAIEGGANRTSGLSVRGVGAANREQIEKVFYRAFTLLMPASSTFVTARLATTQAARDLYGAGGSVETAITQAWEAVGVGVVEAAPFLTLPGSVATGASSTFTVTMPTTGRFQADLNWPSPAATDLDLFLTRPGCPSSTSSCVLASSTSYDSLESVRLPVRQGEQYWVTVQNYSGPSSNFTLTFWLYQGAQFDGVLPTPSNDSNGGDK